MPDTKTRQFFNQHTLEWEEVPIDPPASDWIAGLDLGQVSDYTALSLLERKQDEREEQRDGKLFRRRIRRYACRHLQRWLGVSYADIAEALRPMMAKLNKPVLVVDGTGVGIAVLDILAKARLPVRQLVGVTITAGSNVTRGTKGGWNVPKRLLVSVAQSALQGKRLSIAPKLAEAEALRRELGNFSVKINLNATESFEAWREGQHDDLCLATCLALWYGEQNGWQLKAEHFIV